MLNLERFGRPLGLRWPWLQCTDPDRPWMGYQLPCDRKDMALSVHPLGLPLVTETRLCSKATGLGREDFMT
jgi:hypothetical protein